MNYNVENNTFLSDFFEEDEVIKFVSGDYGYAKIYLLSNSKRKFYIILYNSIMSILLEFPDFNNPLEKQSLVFNYEKGFSTKEFSNEDIIEEGDEVEIIEVDYDDFINLINDPDFKIYLN